MTKRLLGLTVAISLLANVGLAFAQLRFPTPDYEATVRDHFDTPDATEYSLGTRSAIDLFIEQLTETRDPRIVAATRVAATQTAAAYEAAHPRPTRRPAPPEPEHITLRITDGWIDSVARFTLGIVLLWLMAAAILYTIGRVLSAKMLAAMVTPMTISNTGEKLWRTLYRRVALALTLCFYLSLPITALILLTLFLSINRALTSIWDLLILGLSSYALYFMVKAILRAIGILEPKIPDYQIMRPHTLKREEAEPLWQLVEDVARQMNTRPIKSISLSPDGRLTVGEKGGISQQIRDETELSLHIGLAVFNELSESQLRCLLAQEYAFRTHDAANPAGDIAMRVQHAVMFMLVKVNESDSRRSLHPLWWLLTMLSVPLGQVMSGALSIQVVLADHKAAIAYGRQTWLNAAGQRIVARERYELQARQEARIAAHENRPLNNLYTIPVDANMRAELFRQAAAIINPPARHNELTLSARAMLLEWLPSGPLIHEPLDSWHLIPARDELQKKMTQVIQGRIVGTRYADVNPPPVTHDHPSAMVRRP